MSLDKLSSYASRVFCAVSLVLFLCAVIEGLAVKLQFRFWIGHEPGRLVEFAAMLLIPVMTVLLRQIREELRKQK